jgi:hypothetical protein
VTLAALWLVVLAQVPAAPVAAYPSDGAPRDIYTSVSVSAATPDVRRSVFEFRRLDAGYDCNVTNACPAARTTAPFNTLSPAIPDGRWCFRARYENDAGTSPFSAERCFLEDNLDPAGPVSVDAGFSGGQLTLAYVVNDEPEVDASGLSKCCAGAVESNVGTDFSPYCVTNSPWTRTTLSGVLTLPVPPGQWRGFVFCQDRAGNTSARTSAFTEAVNVPGGAQPPPPFWRLPDGGAAPQDTWINDQYLSRATFPGTATTRYMMVEHRVEDAGWRGMAVLGGQNGSTSIFVRTDPPGKLVRYSVLDTTGLTSPYSDELRLRYDNVAPPAIAGCVSAVARDAVSVTFDGGVDTRTATTFLLQAVGDDGGVVDVELDGGAVTLTEGSWTLSVRARDEATNENLPTSCPPVLVDLTGPVCSAPVPAVNGGGVTLTWSCSDALSSVFAFELERDGASLASSLASPTYLDQPGLGTFTWRVRAVDAKGNVGAFSPSSAPLTVASGQSGNDAGVLPDGGAMTLEDGGTPLSSRVLSVGWSCAHLDGAWMLLSLVLLRRRVSRP